MPTVVFIISFVTLFLCAVGFFAFREGKKQDDLDPLDDCSILNDRVQDVEKDLVEGFARLGEALDSFQTNVEHFVYRGNTRQSIEDDILTFQNVCLSSRIEEIDVISFPKNQYPKIKEWVKTTVKLTEKKDKKPVIGATVMAINESPESLIIKNDCIKTDINGEAVFEVTTTGPGRLGIDFKIIDLPENYE